MDPILSGAFKATCFLIGAAIVAAVRSAGVKRAPDGPPLRKLRFCGGGLLVCAIVAGVLERGGGPTIDEYGRETRSTDSERIERGVAIFLVLGLPFLLGAREGFEARKKEGQARAEREEATRRS